MNKLNLLIDETVKDAIKRIEVIKEYAVPLKRYRKKVDGIRFQLVENWCLCKWCQLYNQNNENFAHWASELKACINYLKMVYIKNDIDKRTILTRMLIQDYDYNDQNMIERIIRGKFNRENITNNNEKLNVCKEFANNIQQLIDIISNEDIDTDEYIQNTFI